MSLPGGTGLVGGKARSKILALILNLIFFTHAHFLRLTISKIQFLPYNELKFSI